MFDLLDTLATVLRSLDGHESVLVGLDTPLRLANKAAPLWTTRTYVGSGHAVTVVGYVTADELADPGEQDSGMLASPSMFDAFAASAEREYAARIEEAIASDDATRLAEVRTGSSLGQQVLLFRNSWGTQLGDLDRQFGEESREVAWNTVKARILSAVADPAPVREAFDSCRAASK